MLPSFAQNLNLPSADKQHIVRRAIEGNDATDGYRETYEDLEYERSAGVADIVDLDNSVNDDDNIGDGDATDLNEPELTSARSRGNVVRKRNVGIDKPRSKSRGRRTRSQVAKQAEVDRNEILVD